METYSKEPWNEHWESKTVFENFYKNHIANNYFLGYLAMKDEKIVGVNVGFLKPWIKGMEYYIDDFFVVPEYHRQGIGSEFMAGIKNELAAQNVRAIILSTQRGYPAHKFYENNGFTVIEDSIVLAV
jgi:GNAT superfamily N-acetyltransferase